MPFSPVSSLGKVVFPSWFADKLKLQVPSHLNSSHVCEPVLVVPKEDFVKTFDVSADSVSNMQLNLSLFCLIGNNNIKAVILKSGVVIAVSLVEYRKQATQSKN